MRYKTTELTLRDVRRARVQVERAFLRVGGRELRGLNPEA